MPRSTAFLPNCPGGRESSRVALRFLLDGDRYAIYDPRRAFTPADLPEARAYFIRRAVELGLSGRGPAAAVPRTFLRATGAISIFTRSTPT